MTFPEIRDIPRRNIIGDKHHLLAQIKKKYQANQENFTYKKSYIFRNETMNKSHNLNSACNSCIINPVLENNLRSLYLQKPRFQYVGLNKMDYNNNKET